MVLKMCYVSICCSHATRPPALCDWQAGLQPPRLRQRVWQEESTIPPWREGEETLQVQNCNLFRSVNMNPHVFPITHTHTHTHSASYKPSCCDQTEESSVATASYEVLEYVLWTFFRATNRKTWALQKEFLLFVSVRCSATRLRALLFRHLPALGWLPKYKAKENLLCDVISGVSAGTIQVPQGRSPLLLSLLWCLFITHSDSWWLLQCWLQCTTYFIFFPICYMIYVTSLKKGVCSFPGMAFALLASLPPVNGLYSSFFPLIPYFFMGTAHQMVPGKSEWFICSDFMWRQW